MRLPETDGYLPPASELAGGATNTFDPTPGSVIIGVPKQERGVRPRASVTL